MVDARRRGGNEEPFGPVRPEHASDGWALAGDAAEWWLTKTYGAFHARINGTTGKTCAWRISKPSGDLIREVSAFTVEEAKIACDTWAKEHLRPD